MTMHSHVLLSCLPIYPPPPPHIPKTSSFPCMPMFVIPTHSPTCSPPGGHSISSPPILPPFLGTSITHWIDLSKISKIKLRSWEIHLVHRIVTASPSISILPI